MEKRNVIAILGVPRSGKVEALGYLMAIYHLPKVSFANVISEELLRRGLPVSFANEQSVREELRNIHGEDYYANEVIRMIEADDSNENILVEGLENSADFQILKQHYGARLHAVTIHLPVRNIFREFFSDALQVLRLERGGPIVITDHLVVNEGDISKMTAALDMIMLVLGIWKLKL